MAHLITRLFPRPRPAAPADDTHFHFGAAGLHVCDVAACDSPRADPADR